MRQFVCPRYSIFLSEVSAPVRQGTTGGESDSVSSPGARRASPTTFVDVEGVGMSKAGDEADESVDMEKNGLRPP